MRRICITNDDGIDSPGLIAAVEAVNGIGEIIVIAPSQQQTGMGRGLAGNPDAFLKKTVLNTRIGPVPAFHCDCSPAAIVQHSMITLFKESKPDLLISGINYGENLGSGITQSGTVGAALEAAGFGIPAIAVSLQMEIDEFKNLGERNWDASVHFLNIFAQAMLTGAESEIKVLKIDVPADADQKTNWRLTRQSMVSYYYKEIPDSKMNATLGDAQLKRIRDMSAVESGSDIDVLVNQRMVSVTPLTLDLTAGISFDILEKRFDETVGSLSGS